MQYIKTDLGRFITRCWVEYLDPEGSMELQEVDLHNELRRLYTWPNKFRWSTGGGLDRYGT
jgi:hypothetical protein